METKLYKIIKSEYKDYFELLIEVNGITFQSQSVYTKQLILTRFNISDEEFNILSGKN